MSIDLYIADPHHTAYVDSETGQAVPQYIGTAVNMSNQNAFALYEQLGLPTVSSCSCVDCTAGDLLERCCRWQASPAPFLADSEKVGAVSRTEGGATWMDFGRREGYFADRIEQVKLECLRAIGLGGLACGMYFT